MRRLVTNCIKFYKLKMEAKLTTREEIKEFLEKEQIPFREYQHREALPMEDWVREFKQFEGGSPFIKNLLFSDAKQGLQFIVMEWQTKIHDSFWGKLGSRKQNVRLASEEKLAKLEAKKGSTGLFNIFNDKERDVRNLVFDKKLEGFSHWAFHPQDMCYSLELKREDILGLLDRLEIAYQFLDLEEEFVAKEEPAKNEQDLKG